MLRGPAGTEAKKGQSENVFQIRKCFSNPKIFYSNPKMFYPNPKMFYPNPNMFFISENVFQIRKSFSNPKNVFKFENVFQIRKGFPNPKMFFKSGKSFSNPKMFFKSDITANLWPARTNGGNVVVFSSVGFGKFFSIRMRCFPTGVGEN